MFPLASDTQLRTCADNISHAAGGSRAKYDETMRELEQAELFTQPHLDVSVRARLYRSKVWLKPSDCAPALEDIKVRYNTLHPTNPTYD